MIDSVHVCEDRTEPGAMEGRAKLQIWRRSSAVGEKKKHVCEIRNGSLFKAHGIDHWLMSDGEWSGQTADMGIAYPSRFLE